MESGLGDGVLRPVHRPRATCHRRRPSHRNLRVRRVPGTDRHDPLAQHLRQQQEVAEGVASSQTGMQMPRDCKHCVCMLTMKLSSEPIAFGVLAWCRAGQGGQGGRGLGDILAKPALRPQLPPTAPGAWGLGFRGLG